MIVMEQISLSFVFKKLNTLLITEKKSFLYFMFFRCQLEEKEFLLMVEIFYNL